MSGRGKVGDKLVTRDFGTGTRGFAAADEPGLAVCVMPGTELAFAQDVAWLPVAHSGGVKRQLTTGRQSFDKSIKIRCGHTMTRSNFRMVGSNC
jgi:hypothetical protein